MGGWNEAAVIGILHSTVATAAFVAVQLPQRLFETQSYYISHHLNAKKTTVSFLSCFIMPIHRHVVWCVPGSILGTQ